MSTQPRRSKRSLGALAILAGVVSALIVLPFLTWILVAMILAYVLAPLDDRLSRRVGPGVSAALSIVVGILLIVLPILLIVGVAAQQASDVLAEFDLEDVTQFGETIADRLGVQTATLQDTFGSAIRTGAQGLAGNLFSILGGVPALILGMTVMVFVLFYALRDGDRALAWLRTASPIEPAVQEELIEEFDLLLYNSLVGTVVVAGVQALLLGVLFLVLGISNVVFWTVTTFVASLLPLIGASIIWLPASAYFFLVDQPVDAIVIFVFGALVVSTIDNILRPMVVQRGTELSPAITIVGIFGGIALFGFVGLFLGPIVLGMTKRIVEVLVREYGGPRPVEWG